MKIFYKLSQITATILLLAMTLGPASMPVQPNVPHAQLELVQLAAQRPEQPLAVIVQKTSEGSTVEKIAARLGGIITQDLHIINAFTAQIKAKDALELSRSPDVRWVSLDSPTVSTGVQINTKQLQSAYTQAVRADRVWNEGPKYLQGQGIGVAILDSGDCRNAVFPCNSMQGQNGGSHVIASTTTYTCTVCIPIDYYGHGSLIEGLVGGTGEGSEGKYLGIAPGVNLVSIKVSDADGKSMTSNVVNGLQWVLDHKTTYNIRVVNLSLNSTVAESYHTSPIDAAVEILWFNGIVVVVSAGNDGSSGLIAPANDPFVITVGATDDKGTASLADDGMASFSAYGKDETRAVKPDLVAPGTNLISIVPRNITRIWKDHPSNYTGNSASQEYYMRVSGTSFAAPVVSGAVALLLQSEPNLTPDQVKYRLKATANHAWPGYDATKAGAGLLDIYAAVHNPTIQNANTGLTASHLLWTGSTPIAWNSVAWNSVAWNSVAWNSVAWNSVAWNSVAWNSDYWGK